MQFRRWLGGVIAVGLLAGCLGEARADRTGSVRTEGQRIHGVRPDITVPYLSNGTNAFKASNVAPKIYSSPIVDDPNTPQARPVFNLIFYGSNEHFGDKSNGAGERPPNTLRPAK